MPGGYATLIDFGNRYLDALGARDPARIPVADTLRVTENTGDGSHGGGLWETATGVSYRLVFADDVARQVGMFAVVEEGDGLACFAARLALEGERLSEAESIVARQGEASVWRPQALTEPKPFWEQRNSGPTAPSREALRLTADRYFGALENDTTAHVRFHPECQRVENGVQTTSSPRMGGLDIREQIDRKTFVYITEVRERRFPIVDAERGLVLGIAFLDVPGTLQTVEIDGHVRELPPHARTPRSTLLFELFKVIEGPAIRHIEAMMLNTPFGTRSGWG